MGWNVRSRALVVVWLLLALLPLRGWAHAAVHLPAAHDTPASCHPAHEVAQHGQEVPSPHAAAEPGTHAPHACVLCDLCHGVALPAAGASQHCDYAPPRVERVAAVELGASRAPDRRPPRT